MNGKPVMLLVEADLDEGDDLTLDQAASVSLTWLEAGVRRYAISTTTAVWRFPHENHRWRGGVTGALVRSVPLLALGAPGLSAQNNR